MKIQVETCTKEPREYKGQRQWGVKLPGNDGWVTLYREAKPTKGEIIEVNITERRGNNGTMYRDAFPVMPPLATPTPPPPEPVAEAPAKPDKITWDDVRAIAEAAHEIALKLEPDEITEQGEQAQELVRTDRATARMALVNTILIAFTNNKFIVPEPDDMAPPADGDDVPW